MTPAVPKKRPSILFVSTVARTLEAFFLDHFEHLRGSNWRVAACANGATSSQEIRSHVDAVFEVGWDRSPHHFKENIPATAAFAAILASEAWDIVHFNTPVAAFLGRFAARLQWRHSRPAVVYTAHGFHFHGQGSAAGNLAVRAAEKLAGRWTDLLVTMNQEDLVSARALGLVPNDQVWLGPGVGVDTAEWRRIRSLYNKEDSGGLIACVGEFIPRKRQIDLVNAFSQMPGHLRRTLRVAFAGDGPTMRSVQLRAQELGVADAIDFLGHADPRPVIGEALCLVHPSSQEGLPVAVMEAMAAGVPCIGADVRGTRDLLGGNTGILYPVEDSPALARAIETLVASPAHREALRQAALTRIEHHSLSHALSFYDGAYAEAARLRRVPHRE